MNSPAGRPADYARWRNSRLGALTEPIEQQTILNRLGNVTGRRVLDLGCGDGAYSVSASRSGAFVMGVDVSAEMLRAASLRTDVGGTGARWCQASADALPFQPNSFDVVLAVTLLCFVERPELAVTEAARVLRPGGALVLGELGRYSLWTLSRKVRGWLGSRMWRHARFWNVRELRRVIEAVGLQFVCAQACVYYPPAPFVADFLGPMDRAFSHLGQFGAAFVALKARKP